MVFLVSLEVFGFHRMFHVSVALPTEGGYFYHF